MSYTPGPWRLASRDVGYRVLAPGESGHRNGMCYVADVYGDLVDADPLDNARLIAAAPELLDALQTLHAEHVCNYDPSIMSWDDARAAINKALGGD